MTGRRDFSLPYSTAQTGAFDRRLPKNAGTLRLDALAQAEHDLEAVEQELDRFWFLGDAPAVLVAEYKRLRELAA